MLLLTSLLVLSLLKKTQLSILFVARNSNQLFKSKKRNLNAVKTLEFIFIYMYGILFRLVPLQRSCWCVTPPSAHQAPAGTAPKKHPNENINIIFLYGISFNYLVIILLLQGDVRAAARRGKKEMRRKGATLFTHTHTHTHRVSNIHIYNPETSLTASQWATGVFRSPISLLFIYFFPHLFSVRLHIYKGCETRRRKRRRRKNCSSNSSRVWARLECIPS